MANTDNTTSHLEVGNEEYKEFDYIFFVQDMLQEKISGKRESQSHKTESISQLIQKLMFNKHAFDDEFSEFMDAMGGINDGIGNSAWKWWKKDSADNLFLKDLSESDLKELKMEYVDMFHFFINIGLLIGISGSELVNMYLSKNKENIERQKRGY